MEAGDAPPLANDDPACAVLELHAMLDSAPDDRTILATTLPRSRRIDLGNNITIPALARDEFFAHVVTHVSRHHRFEGELRSLLDVALLLRSRETELDWSSLLPDWERRGVLEWIALTLTLANVLLDAPLPEPFRALAPSDEAIAIAAEQLWVVKEKRIPGGIAHLLTGIRPAPVHADAHETRESVPIPHGLAGVRARFERQWHRAARVVEATRRGAMRPRNVAAMLDLWRKRERLFTLVERKR